MVYLEFTTVCFGDLWVNKDSIFVFKDSSTFLQQLKLKSKNKT